MSLQTGCRGEIDIPAFIQEACRPSEILKALLETQRKKRLLRFAAGLPQESQCEKYSLSERNMSQWLWPHRTLLRGLERATGL
jgi:hypothetical protein